jgi:hypothetical protein
VIEKTGRAQLHIYAGCDPAIVTGDAFDFSGDFAIENNSSYYTTVRARFRGFNHVFVEEMKHREIEVWTLPSVGVRSGSVPVKL